ncbi:MAG TPA: C2 family cysteine protease [Trichormus sp.]
MTNPVEVHSSERSTPHKAESAHHASTKMSVESNENANAQRNSAEPNGNARLEGQGVLPKVDLHHEKNAPEQNGQVHTANRDASGMPTGQFATQALRLMPQIDSNHDGKMSPEELKAAMQNPQFKGADAEVVAGLYRAESSLQNLSGMQDKSKSVGITAEDLVSFDKLYPQEMLTLTRQSLVDDFGRLDTNHDGRLSKDELSTAINNNDKDKAIAKFFLDNFDQAEKAHLDVSDLWSSHGLTAGDITDFKFNNEDKVSKAIDQINDAIKNVYNHQADMRSDNLWGPQDDYRKNIRPEAIAQGDIGDCFFLSSIAAMAKSDPEKIHEMIKSAKGGYTVTFPGDKDHPVFVSAPTEMEQGLGNSPSQYGAWAGVLEKAYGKYLQEHGGKSDILDPAEAANDGGLLSKTLTLLSGEKFTYSKVTEGMRIPFNDKMISDEDLKSVLSRASSEPMCCGTRPGIKDSEYPADHAYTVIGFDPKANNGAGDVIVRNPWGSNDHKHPNGISHMTFAQFKHRFDEVSYSDGSKH